MDIPNIISQMTLEEKASLCSGANFWETKAIERLGIPSIIMTDGPHGLRKQEGSFDHLGLSDALPATCFPPAALTACSFDPELLREMGRALGEECAAMGVNIILGPGVNIKRSPLCGRNFEYFSEDPLLSGALGAALIGGVQSRGVGTSLKHYAANNQETRRFSSDARVDERTLFEIYLPAFARCVKEQPATVMCAYNRVNGPYASEHPELLTEILREKWGFEGFVVSDWGAVNDRVKGLAAGLELEMPYSGGDNDRKIADAVRAGILPMETLDRAVARILGVIQRVSGHSKPSGYDKDAHHALVRRVAAESMVLLQNDGTLPLHSTQKIAIVGAFAEQPRYQGAGSSQVNPTRLDTPLDAIRAYGDVTYARGYVIDNCDALDDSLADEAIAAARAADVCVVLAGLPSAYESEGFDRDHMRLPDGQNRLIERLAETGVPVAVVLQNGSPVEMPWAHRVSAILEAYLGGQAGGGAIADVLFGTANPCGKLAETFPKKLSDNPSYLNFPGEGDIVEYREGVFVGYRYYDAKEMDVLFPFGHGLSYTRFDYANLRLSAEKITDAEILTVTLDVTNTGSVAGKEIVQLYVGPKDKDDRLSRPVRELRAFDKVCLQPGETKTVTFALDKSAFAYYHTQIHDWHVLTGTYVVMIGRSSRDIALRAEVEVLSTVRIPMRATINTPIKDIRRMENGEALVGQMMAAAADMPGLFAEGTPSGGNADKRDSFAIMIEKMLPEMVPRAMTMMARLNMTYEQIQALLDTHVNAGVNPAKGVDVNS